MNDDKYDGRDIKIPVKNKGKFALGVENYWYHYKWHSIAAVFVILVLTVALFQTCGREKEELSVIYAGPVQLSAKEADEIKKVLSAQLNSGRAGDGGGVAAFPNYRVLSENQIREIEASGIGETINRGNNADNKKVYDTYLMTGDVSICFLDPWLYQSLRSAQRLADISSFEGFVQDTELGNYGMRLSETMIYKYFGAFKALPEDTVVCLLLPNYIGRNSDPEVYAREKEYFSALITFKPPV